MYNKENELAKWAMGLALREGAENARITIDKGCSNTIGITDGKIEKMLMSNDSKLYVELFVNGRYGCFATNILEKLSLEHFIKESSSIVKLLTEERNRTLPPVGLYYKGEGVDLGLFDKSYYDLSNDKRKEIAFETFNRMEGKSEKIISAESEYSDTLFYEYMIDSQGFEGVTLQSDFDIMASCTVKGEGEARYESYWGDNSKKIATLNYEKCGEIALERALASIGPKKMKSGKYNMVVENSASSKLVSPIYGALSGGALEQKRSFLLDSLGKRIFSEKLTITDTPHSYGQNGARLFDSEGLKTEKREIIENGVIKTYFINTYHANKLGCQPTIESPSVTAFAKSTVERKNGESYQQAIMREMDSGILITGFNGGNSNSTTGDFSFGIEGFYFKDGNIEHPVSEMNITGNMITLWNNFNSNGDDALEWTPWQTPTLAFEKVDFNGVE